MGRYDAVVVVVVVVVVVASSTFTYSLSFVQLHN